MGTFYSCYTSDTAHFYHGIDQGSSDEWDRLVEQNWAHIEISDDLLGIRYHQMIPNISERVSMTEASIRVFRLFGARYHTLRRIYAKIAPSYKEFLLLLATVMWTFGER